MTGEVVSVVTATSSTFPSELSFIAGEAVPAPTMTVHAEETAAGAARLTARRGIERLPSRTTRSASSVSSPAVTCAGYFCDRTRRYGAAWSTTYSDTMGLGPNAVTVHVVDGIVSLDSPNSRPDDIASHTSPAWSGLVGPLRGHMAPPPPLAVQAMLRAGPQTRGV
ncbi:hypothetical protein ACLF6K_35375 [Streptomyces xanthophaeus]|uniref:hypothetical protein n=1 Tax=Streptomyces xanthophaeus TaxID=67385 RepID=UPI00398F945D